MMTKPSCCRSLYLSRPDLLTGRTGSSKVAERREREGDNPVQRGAYMDRVCLACSHKLVCAYCVVCMTVSHCHNAGYHESLYSRLAAQGGTGRMQAKQRRTRSDPSATAAVMQLMDPYKGGRKDAPERWSLFLSRSLALRLPFGAGPSACMLYRRCRQSA